MDKYYYVPFRNRWAVRRSVEDGGEFVESYATKEEARKRVYELNKWL